MICELEKMDCVDIAYGAHIINDYKNVTLSKIMNLKSTRRFEDHLIEDEKVQLESIIAGYEGLLKVANKCGCNIDLKTGMLK